MNFLSLKKGCSTSLFFGKPYFYKMYAATFNKSDRLKSAKKIKQLFETGDGFIEFPFRVVWKWTEAKEFSEFCADGGMDQLPGSSNTAALEDNSEAKTWE